MKYITRSKNPKGDSSMPSSLEGLRYRLLIHGISIAESKKIGASLKFFSDYGNYRESLIVSTQFKYGSEYADTIIKRKRHLLWILLNNKLR